MFVVEDSKNGPVSLPARLLNEKQLRACSSHLAQRILRELANKQSYPRELSKKLKVHEQKIYYNIRKLEKTGIIEVTKRISIGGTFANVYSVKASSFVLALKGFSEANKFASKSSSDFLSPIIDNNEFNGMIIVGSPDPHGIEMARSRDGYYGMDLALFLGSYLMHFSDLCVRLDTEVRNEDLQKNLILIGGPVVNMISNKVNESLPVRFEKKKNWSIYSKVTGKHYFADECGIIIKAKNPFNPKKWILVVAGKRYAGTRAVTLAFIKYLDEISKGNKFDSSISARIVEGLDKNADGIVDDVRFVE